MRIWQITFATSIGHLSCTRNICVRHLITKTSHLIFSRKTGSSGFSSLFFPLRTSLSPNAAGFLGSPNGAWPSATSFRQSSLGPEATGCAKLLDPLQNPIDIISGSPILNKPPALANPSRNGSLSCSF